MKPPPNTGTASDVPPLEPDIYPARCHLMAYVGQQEDEWQGQVRLKPKVVLGFTLPTTSHTFDEERGPEPYRKYKQYTYSLARKSHLRHTLEKWRGQAWSEDFPNFDIENVLGTAVRLSTILDETGTKWWISDFIKIARQDDCPALAGPAIAYDVREHNETVFQALPEFIQQMAQKSTEWNDREQTAGSASSPAVPEEEDDIPF